MCGSTGVESPLRNETCCETNQQLSGAFRLREPVHGLTPRNSGTHHIWPETGDLARRRRGTDVQHQSRWLADCPVAGWHENTIGGGNQSGICGKLECCSSGQSSYELVPRRSGSDVQMPRLRARGEQPFAAGTSHYQIKHASRQTDIHTRSASLPRESDSRPG